jgi:putative membrane protein
MRSHRNSLLTVIVFACLTASAQSASDKTFLKKTAQNNLLEVQLGHLASTKTARPDIKLFAGTMISDHEKLARSLGPLLGQAGIALQSSLNSGQRKLYLRLKALSGDDFDGEYIKEVQIDHNRVLAAYKNELRSTNDQRIKSVLHSAQAVIAAHAKMANDIARKLGLSPPGQTERDAGKLIR